MSELRDFLASVDDEYLTGLSNKGIVKRSYKDLEKEHVELSETASECKGVIGDISVTLALPLADSRCSCPAHGICKHIVMTILALKQSGGEEEQDANNTIEKGGRERDEHVSTNGEEQDRHGNMDVGKRDDHRAEKMTQDEHRNHGKKNEEQDVGCGVVNETQGEQGYQGKANEYGLKNHSDSNKNVRAGQGGIEEVRKDGLKVEDQRQFPSIAVLKKNVSNKEFVKIISELEQGSRPEVVTGDIITVKDVETNTTVKLAFPIQYSTCTCHSDKLCRHKVKAILYVQLQSGALSMEEIQRQKGESLLREWDAEGIREVLSDIRGTLTEMVMTGAARMSPELPGSLERLAIRCHNVQLADLETRMRVLSETAASYQGRKAGVSVSYIMRQISESYLLIDAIEQKLSRGEDILSLAGTFRSEYQEVGELTLSGMGMRHFVSDAGYEGDTVYFLEDSGEWYTYTVARPTIYDRKKRRGSFSEAPWGLPCNLSRMAESRIVLKGGKANAEHRLSSTSRASAELLGESNVGSLIISDSIYDDFAKLWEAFSLRLREASEVSDGGADIASEVDKLFLVRPSQIYDMHYDETSQRLIFYLEDKLGRSLRAQLTYSREEAAAIKSLERLKRSIEKRKDKVPIFLGILYVENGECVMYPIETFG